MQQKGLNGNQLKLLALIAMTVDHIGLFIFPHEIAFRIIGRLAMPVFAFMIAEGCNRTRNRKRYFFTVLLVGLICQLVYAVVMISSYQCIMITFAMSIAMICLFKRAQERGKMLPWLLFALGVAAVYFICEELPVYLHRSRYSVLRDFDVDYGFWGVMLPVLIYSGKDKWQRLFMALAGLSLIALDYHSIQWYSLAALPFLALYNGQRRQKNIKFFFYIYYPAHLVVLYAIGRYIHL